MRKLWRKFTVIATLFGLAFAFHACQEEPILEPEQPESNIIRGQYIVVMNGVETKSTDWPTYEEGLRLATERTMEILYDFQISATNVEFVYGFVLNGFSATLTDEELLKLREDERIAYIEPNQRVSISMQTNATWGIDRVDQRNLPLNRTYTWDGTGSGVWVYVFDTGIRYNHVEFGGRASFGFDAFGGNGSDGNGHGTHVAGTIGGTTFGVAKNARLVSIRVLNNAGSGTLSGIIAGMDWVAANRRLPAVANMSLGSSASTSLDAAVTRLFNAGVPVIVAAGNSNLDACGFSPARAAWAFTVASTTSTDARSSFSNFGNCVNLFAPGSSITAAWHTSNTAINTISGTSMASPHVAGAAAIFLGNNISATPLQVYNFLLNNSTRGIVTNSRSVNNHLLFTLGTR
ncbi:MAG TPA: S8 family peptidase [Bacteroidales bacterium]|nr:S8 family peptidase [Bacteroidales bacterium]